MKSSEMRKSPTYTSALCDVRKVYNTTLTLLIAPCFALVLIFCVQQSITFNRKLKYSAYKQILQK